MNPPDVNADEAIGRALAAEGVRTVFGVVGSGNFHVTNALVAGGARYVAARHEGGAATMADAYARMSGEVGVVTVHQGPGLTNMITGLAEAAKSRTPLLVLAGEVTSPLSNFWVDQAALAHAVGALSCRITSAGTAVAEATAAYRLARRERRAVLLNLPLDVQAQRAGNDAPGPVEPFAAHEDAPLVSADLGSFERLAEALAAAERPVFVAGRGARRARRELEALGERVGALLATSAVARGLFKGNPWDLDVSGGFATPLAAELIRDADLIVGWGCALNMWTMRHGALISPTATVVQVDLDASALGAHRSVSFGVVGEVAGCATAVTELIEAQRAGYRSDELAGRIAAGRRWQDVAYDDESGAGRIDPRTLTIRLDELLPAERIVSVDSGNFMGYPAMFLDVPDEHGFCFTQSFQSIGLGLATAIGAALARPDRLPVAALGDGGALMGVAELETVVRLGLPMVVVVYDDEGYGAEVHHFRGAPHDTVTFPPVDLASIGRGFGCAAVTVTSTADLDAVREWLDGPRDLPLLIHAKVTRERGSWWLEEAFRGH
ncbi:thiamine pyrophosphate-binding protein [Herbidospora galbida]|uniref:Thiamine pyrophosphate-binding protein n=1 Tax=Herbidospora galbida TaxID=2575442 RepID=A0A4U3MD75_9ACTN|nr:thiamine pyrophosphate-binding protein [Herbidospora galbida]TKK86124.1 thiamine pyrophosphate-binding protein [Herbidospora galbida]